MAIPDGAIVQLEQGAWRVGELLGTGAFGEVRAATGPHGEEVALKFVQKASRTERELLMASDARGLTNVLPILDVGEYGDAWVMAMPRAEKSLRQFLEEVGTALLFHQAHPILLDVAKALAAIDGHIVHRDLKPQNILHFDGVWHIADFGIARYADVATATQTWRGAKSNPYAAPEQWRSEHATARTDVYAFGVVAYEMLSGDLPFPGPSAEDYRRQHLLDTPKSLHSVPDSIASLVTGCLVKQQEARPTAARVVKILERATIPQSETLARLQSINKKAQEQAATKAAAIEVERLRRERRERLFDEAQSSWAQILTRFSERLSEHLYMAKVQIEQNKLQATLDNATLVLHRFSYTREADWQGQAPAFDVIAHAEVTVQAEPGSLQNQHYTGRSHSLWYCDAVAIDEFQWFEVAFTKRGVHFINQPYKHPIALRPTEDAGWALNPSAGGLWSLAQPFQAITPYETDALVDQWLELFADAVEGKLSDPGRQGISAGSYRTAEQMDL